MSSISFLSQARRQAFPLGNRFGALAALFVATALTACDAGTTKIVGVDEFQAPDLTKADIQIVSGAAQEAEVASILPTPLTVQVVDESGKPIPGVALEWIFVAGRGIQSGAGGSDTASPRLTTTTNAQGQSSLSWELGIRAGIQEASASIVVPATTSAAGAAGGNGRGKRIGLTAQAKPGAADSVTVSPNDVDVPVGGSATLAAVVKDSYGNVIDGASPSWSSSDETVILVDSQGTVSALKDGTATVTAKSGKAAGSAGVTAATTTVAVGSVTVSAGNNQTGTVGEALPVASAVKVVDGQGNPSVGTVVQWAVTSGGGELSAGSNATDAQGIASVTWTLGGKTGAQAMAATVTSVGSVVFNAQAEAGAPAVVQVTPSGASVAVGAQLQFQATAEDRFGNPLSGATFTWGTSNSTILRVDGAGLATGVSDGSASVTATAGAAVGSQQVTVTATSSTPQNPGTVTDLTVIAATDSSLTLRWTEVDDGTGNPAKYAIRYGSPTISWGAAYATEITVAGTGVGAVKEHTWNGLTSGTDHQFQTVAYRGTLNVDAVFGAASNTASGTTVVNGEAGVPVRMTVSPASVSFTEIGQTAQLTATAYDAFGARVDTVTFEFSSSDPAVVEVDAMGRLTANALGTAVISVTSICCGGEVPTSVDETSDSLASFSEGFEAGSLTNADGFRWGGGTSFAVTSQNPRSGSYSGQFYYAGTSALSGDAFSELDFDLGAEYQEVWVEYYEFIPSNYVHRYPDSVDDNNKWFYLADTKAEGGTGYHVRSLLESRVGDGSGAGSLDRARPMWGTNASRNGRASSQQGMAQPQGLIVESDRGTWVQWRFYFKVSDVGQVNGVWKMWKNGEVFINETGQANGATDGQVHGYRVGYLKGWSNSGYSENTTFHIDDFKVFTSNPGW